MASRSLLRSLWTTSTKIYNFSKPCLTSAPTLRLMTARSTSIKQFHTSSKLCSENIVTIQDEKDWQKTVLKNELPVIVDFYADWCGPCKLLAPRLESQIAKYTGKVILAKVNIDNFTELAIDHGVEAVPSVIAFKDGEQTHSFVGLKDDAEIEAFVKKTITEE
ncbi:DgyrCDS6187 [Dimorphilus gyrociliatus]|uniref:DgyrCDS6187 n=1 Tax=Dimorphilus gyrociliatus TaxID=2664684 RepID=A0A7I8VMC2_9ANNE|nr:DgyrCDS6187 [Dimorphilus gyrociliatus]